MIIIRLISSIRRREKEKAQAKEFEFMLSCIQRMYPYRFHGYRRIISEYIRKATDEEVAKLILDSQSIQKSSPGSGYYVPSYSNYVTRSLETWPDRVYVLNHMFLSAIEDQDDESIYNSQWKSHLPTRYLHKDLVVFNYNDFGFPETHLCGREVYVFYDAEKKEIVAHVWRGVS